MLLHVETLPGRSFVIPADCFRRLGRYHSALRSAIIGEALKRIITATGRTAIGDVHLGDWGLPMGLVLAELEERYGNNLPILTTDLLNEIYPYASKKSKEDSEFLEKARTITAKLQKGDPAYKATWKTMIALSIEDIKKTFTRLGATFDYWYGESDSSKYVPELIETLKNKDILVESEGAQVVEVAKVKQYLFLIAIFHVRLMLLKSDLLFQLLVYS